MRNLLYTIRLKLTATQLNVETITADDGQIIARLLPGVTTSPLQRALEHPAGVRIGMNQLRFDIARLGSSWPEILAAVLGKMIS